MNLAFKELSLRYFEERSLWEYFSFSFFPPQSS